MTKSRQLHNIFEECLELAFHGESVEDCLRRYPEHADELKGLVETAVAAMKAVAVQPGAEFRERSRQQLYAAMRDMREGSRLATAKRHTFRWSWQPTWAVVTAAFIALVTAASGTVLASANSMPDQPLYAVKVASEQARLALTSSPLAKAELYAALADRRVTEIVYLAEKGKVQQLAGVTEDLNGQLGKISELAARGSAGTLVDGEPALMAAPAATGSQEVAPPSETRGEPGETLTPTPATVPAAGTPTLKETQVVAPSFGATNTEDGTGSLVTASRNGAFGTGYQTETRLTAALKSQAVNNSARLRAALLTAPPETREALLRAIAVSETGYEKVLQSLVTN